MHGSRTRISDVRYSPADNGGLLPLRGPVSGTAIFCWVSKLSAACRLCTLRWQVNITDIDDKIILRARRNKLVNDYIQAKKDLDEVCGGPLFLAGLAHVLGRFDSVHG